MFEFKSKYGSSLELKFRLSEFLDHFKFGQIQTHGQLIYVQFYPNYLENFIKIISNNPF